MTDRSGEWDAERGYRFNPDKDRVPIPDNEETFTTSGEPIHNERSENDSPAPTRDVNALGRRIAALQNEPQNRQEEQVTIEPRRRQSDNTITSDETDTNTAFRRRRLRNRAIRKVKDHLRSRGYSDEFVQENEQLIREKVNNFLA